MQKIGKLALTGQQKQPNFCSSFIQYVKRWPSLLCQRLMSPNFVDLPFQIKKLLIISQRQLGLLSFPSKVKQPSSAPVQYSTYYKGNDAAELLFSALRWKKYKCTTVLKRLFYSSGKAIKLLFTPLLIYASRHHAIISAAHLI